MSGNYVQALALGIDTGWRRLPAEERRCGLEAIAEVLVENAEVTSFSYSMIGLQAGTDLLLWSLGPSLEALEERAAAVLRTPMGGYLTVRESFLGLIQPSQYVKRPTEQEQSLFSGERSRYLIVYPFTKDTSWYLLGKEARQGVMNEHIKVGHQYPQVRQLLAYSFGLDDQDYVVAYETDDLAAFGQLVRDLRGTESRRSTVRDTPILTGVHRSMADIGRLLGS